MTSATSAASEARRPFAFGGWLAGIALVGVALRLFYINVVTTHTPLGADAVWYDLTGGLLHDGYGYSDPRTLFQLGRAVPTGAWPPLYPAFLAVANHVGLHGALHLRAAGVLPAAITIVLTGLLGRRVFGDAAVGLVAAAMVAVLPLAVANDSSLMSETLSVPFTVATLLVAQHLLTNPRRPWLYALFGVLTGLSALARADALVIGLVVLLVLLAAAWSERRQVLLGGLVAVLALVCVVAPWSVRNHDRLGTFTISTTSTATAIAGANCVPTYSRHALGSWDFTCISFGERTPDNEVVWSKRIMRRGVHYATHHVVRLPAVGAARVLREWGVWKPTDVARSESVETRRYGWQLAGWIIELPVLVLAAIAVVRNRTQWRRITVLLAALGGVTVTALVTYGNQRFRAPAEPALAILAAWTLIELTRSRTRRRPRAAVPIAEPTLP